MSTPKDIVLLFYIFAKKNKLFTEKEMKYNYDEASKLAFLNILMINLQSFSKISPPIELLIK